MNGREPNDNEIIRHLECRGKYNNVSWISHDDHFKADELSQRGLRLIETNNAKDIINVGIIVDNSLNWSTLPVCPTKRICISFEGCSVPLYECLFTRLGVRLPFSDFEVAMMNRLRAAPLQPHHGAWAYMKVFQLFFERKYLKPSP